MYAHGRRALYLPCPAVSPTFLSIPLMIIHTNTILYTVLNLFPPFWFDIWYTALLQANWHKHL